MLRILHTADWQLGKRFANVTGDAGASLREARLTAVEVLARLATQHRVDAVLVAGDIFDTQGVARQTVVKAIDAMRGFPGPWVLLPGNHDALLAECTWRRLQREGCPVHLRLALEPEPMALADGRLVVLPAPLRGRRTYDDVTEWMDGAQDTGDAVRVGLAHGAVLEHLPAAADSGNPIAFDRARRARLDYLALGDWHGTHRIDERTWYAGTPEPDRFPDNDPGNALLVEIDAPGAPPRVTPLRTAAYDWRHLELDCTSLDPEGIPAAVDARLGARVERRRLLLRLQLHGVVSLAVRLGLDRTLAALGDELHWLHLVDHQLRTSVDVDEVALAREDPAIAAVAGRLGVIAGEGDAAARATAELALRYLVAETRGNA